MSNYKQVTQKQRYQIFGYLEADLSDAEIAIKIGTSKSTVGREIKRNSIDGKYDPEKAEKLADFRKRNSHRRTKINGKMEEIIVTMLEKNQTSPEGISGWCKENNIEMVSYPTIYTFINVDKENGGELSKHLRFGHKKRKKHGVKENRGQIKDRVSIDNRPAIVDEKSRIGDFEGDTIVGANHKGVIITLNDRKTMTVFMAKVKSKNSKIVADEIIRQLKPLKGHIHTLTLDNGKEFADHKRISHELGIDIYFAHPYSSYERGLNENSNGLIRQYLPKGTNFENISDSDIFEIIYKLNTRPRKRLGFISPAAAFDRELNR